MKALHLVLASILIFASAVHLAGSDQAFGIDTLPVLYSDSSLVVEADQAAPVPATSPRVQMFRLHLREGIRGDFSVDQLLAFVPRSGGVVESAQFSNAMVFLAGPLSQGQLAEWGIDSTEPIFQVAGGKGGIVPKTPVLRPEVERFLSISDFASPEAFAWATQNMLSSDPFLQRSAAYKLGRYETKIALDVLQKAVRSSKVTLPNQEFVIQIIAADGSDHALSILKSIAEDKKTEKPVRIATIYAVRDVVGGMKLLENWSKAADVVLQKTSTKVIQMSRD